MDEVTEAFKGALIAFAKSEEFGYGLAAIFAALVGAVVAIGKWVQGHFAASAARQAVDQHGPDLVAEQAAADELQRIPWALRPGNVIKAATKAVEKQREVRASKAPPKP